MGGERTLAEERELRHPGRSASPRPEENTVGGAGRGDDADVVLAVRLEDARLEEREAIERGHELTDDRIVCGDILLLHAAIERAQQRRLPSEVVVLDTVGDDGSRDGPV